MRKLFGLIAILTFLPVLGLAQTDFLKAPNWSVISPVNEPFTTEVPVSLDVYSSQDGSLRKYSGQTRGKYFFIFSEKSDKDSISKMALRFARSFLPIGKVQIFDTVTAEKFQFKDDEGFFHSVLFFTSNNRQYLFHGISREDNDQMIERFFGSLRIGGQMQTDAVAGPKENETKPVPNMKEVAPSKSMGVGSGEGIGSGSGNTNSGGIGSGNGRGVGGGIGTGPVKAPEIGVSSPLNILSKARPPYTDMARTYEIAGFVRLRVTFLDSGKIGSVTPTIFLPFGLTKNAIAAAKLIGFQPKVVNGTPISVVKLVEYNFTIY